MNYPKIQPFSHPEVIKIKNEKVLAVKTSSLLEASYYFKGGCSLCKTGYERKRGKIALYLYFTGVPLEKLSGIYFDNEKKPYVDLRHLIAVYNYLTAFTDGYYSEILDYFNPPPLITPFFSRFDREDAE